MQELPWIMTFWSRVRRFAKYFHEWKSLLNHITGELKLLLTVKNILFYFLHAIMFCAHNSAQNNHRLLNSPLSPRTIVSDVALWRHYSWSMTSHKREVLALWRHILRLFLHAQIATKAISYSERPRGAGFRSVKLAERWRENPARALAQAGFSQHLECGIHQSESSPEGSFALIPRPVTRWANTTP